MKSLFKNVFSLAALLGSLTLAPLAHADTTTPSFNTKEGDQEFLVGRNVTQNGVYTDPVNGVKATDEVEVSLYYHNASEDEDANVAHNVKIQVALPTTESSSHVLVGTLSADNLAAVHGTVVNGQEVGKENLTINTTAPTTISFVPGSVRWYPNHVEQKGPGANLPNGQNGDSIVATGITIGDLRGCFQYSGFIKFRVKFAGEVPPAKAILDLKKEVRKAGTDNAFVTKNTVTPGDQVEYRLTVKNIDGEGVATAVRLKDQLPDGLTYVGPTQLTRNGVVTTLPDGITSADGIEILSDLKPLEQVYVTFKAVTANNFQDNKCVVNTVSVTANNADLPGNKTAETCFSVAPAPTPTPTPKPTVTPKPELPKTGPGVDVSSLLGMTGIAGTIGRYAYLKKQVKKQARQISVL